MIYMNFCRKGAKGAKGFIGKSYFFFAFFAPLRQVLINQHP